MALALMVKAGRWQGLAALLGFPFLRHLCHSQPHCEIVAARAVYKIEARELFGPMRLFG